MRRLIVTLTGTSVGMLLLFVSVLSVTGVGVDLSGHGIAALVLGVLFTVGLGSALMALSFHSSRTGQDQ